MQRLGRTQVRVQERQDLRGRRHGRLRPLQQGSEKFALGGCRMPFSLTISLGFNDTGGGKRAYIRYIDELASYRPDAGSRASGPGGALGRHSCSRERWTRIDHEKRRATVAALSSPQTFLLPIASASYEPERMQPFYQALLLSLLRVLD